MTNSKTLLQNIIAQLNENDEAEKGMLAVMLLEHVFHLDRSEILSGKSVEIKPQQTERTKEIVRRLNRHEPIQYITGEAFFYGRRFEVGPEVLIPRPETELLIDEVVSFSRNRNSLRILDIGTGSGCIAVTLAKELPAAEIFASDISTEALSVAKKNSTSLNATVSFFEHDVLRSAFADHYDVLVSNPPYIAREEQNSLDVNVVDHEPHLALFVEGSDPLLFYRAIAHHARTALNKDGLVCVEIHEDRAKETLAIFEQENLGTTVLSDLSGKPRFIRAVK